MVFGKRVTDLPSSGQKFINSLPPTFINLFRKKRRILPIWSSIKYCVVIKSSFLIYYPAGKHQDGDEKSYKFLDLLNCEIKIVDDDTAGFVFTIVPEAGAGSGKLVTFAADNEKDRTKFIRQVTKLQHRALSVGDFHVHKVIGKGHYGRVLLVQGKRDAKLYALKEMKLGRTKQKVIQTERMVMEWIGSSHPFLLSLDYAFGQGRSMFLVSQFMPGGDLFLQLQKYGGYLSEDAVRFYGAELLLALEHLQQVHIIHRDIKPENILLDRDGHIKLADLGLAKRLDSKFERTFTLCGTDAYLPPELVQRASSGHSFPVDMWQLGCFLYELYTGHPPFYLPQSTQRQTHHRILHQQVAYPRNISPGFRALLCGLLQKNPTERLVLAQVKRHAFFQTLDWTRVRAKALKPPIVPAAPGKDYVENFDAQFTGMSSDIHTVAGCAVSRDFAGFDFVRESISNSPPSAKSVVGTKAKSVVTNHEASIIPATVCPPHS